MSTKSKVILGLVGAAAAGVLVGLLIAPEKGADLRKKVKDTAGDWASHLTDLFANAKGEIDSLKNKGAKASDHLSLLLKLKFEVGDLDDCLERAIRSRAFAVATVQSVIPSRV